MTCVPLLSPATLLEQLDIILRKSQMKQHYACSLKDLLKVLNAFKWIHL